MTNRTATHIIFEQIFPREEVRVPLADAAKFQDEHGGSHRMTKVEWADGTWSWGQLWWFGGTSTVCRIGAGAYGNHVVWRHPISPYDRAALRQAGIIGGDYAQN
jgi:hypothetical protein